MVKHRGDDICGVLLLDKPTGRSSNHVLQDVKRLYNAKKAGHTGSLDPLATGLLPICFGKATCLSQYFLHSDKQYETVIQFGVTTDSHDSDGNTVTTREVEFSKQQFEQALMQFVGDIEQVPPMVSALKHKGQPLYKLALKGQEIERKPRAMKVYSLAGELLEGNQARLTVHCSSGFYVRQLAADLGEVLGCGAHVVDLRRTASKYLSVADAFSLEQVKDDVESRVERLISVSDCDAKSRAELINERLLAPEDLLKSLPKVIVNSSQAGRLANGQTVAVEPEAITAGSEPQLGKINAEKAEGVDEHCRVYQQRSESDAEPLHFMGIGEWRSSHLLKIRNRFNDVV